MATKPIFSISVRRLVEFVHRTGDLGGDGEFTGPNRALAGTLGHQAWQKSQPPEYQKEVRLVYDLAGEDFILRVQGRLDGLLVAAGGVTLEEIKTVGASWDGRPDPLHSAQAKCYAAIYTRQQGVGELTVQLTYLNLDAQKVREFREVHTRAALAEFFDATLVFYQRWMAEQFQWRKIRDAALAKLGFPFPKYRAGQREMAVAVYRAVTRGERLFLEAPTGIGKTISALFPAIKALGEGKLERIFYLTATTPGRVVAEKALEDMRGAGLRLRTLTLTAKAKLCVQKGQPCEVMTCPLALGYYDRRHAALRSGLAREEITRPVLEAMGAEHRVCPYALSLDLAEWVEVVIGDYNYVFDPRVYLRRQFEEGSGAFAFLVDEAHNLIERARAMFSAELSTEEVRAVARVVRKPLGRCARALGRLAAAMDRLAAGGAGDVASASEANAESDLFTVPVVEAKPKVSAPVKLASRDEAITCAELPEELAPLLERAMALAAEWLVKNEAAEFRPALLELYFRLHAFARTAEAYDECYVTLCLPGAAARVKLFCLDPASQLRKAMAHGQATVCFSATLSPLDYFRRVLGGEEADRAMQLASPFPPEHLGVFIQDRIRTQFRDRANSLGEVVQAIISLVTGRTGNYLVYLPAYQYLHDVVAACQEAAPEMAVLVQRPAMSEGEREAFIAAFVAEPARSLVGFAVLGGIFGEGIDLVGERLIGVVIIGVGLPQLEPERDLIAAYFEAQAGRGFEHAYTFPGMNRVLQAVGRVIRSETDRGVVLLVDQRFRELRYRQLFPAHWQPVAVNGPAALRDRLAAFWAL